MYFGFKILPALGGILSIYLGYRLFILGVTGQASLSVESKSVSGQLLNAAPGLFFAVGGIATLIAVVWRSVKFNVTGNKLGKDITLGRDIEVHKMELGPMKSPTKF